MRSLAGFVASCVEKVLARKIALAQGTFRAKSFPIQVLHIPNLSYTSYLLAYEDGTHIVFRNVGI
jgi:hypothetical protein